MVSIHVYSQKTEASWVLQIYILRGGDKTETRMLFFLIIIIK